MSDEARESVQSARISGLIQSAMQLTRERRTEDARRVWEDVLSTNPDHPQALFYLGQYALFHKDLIRASELFRHAARSDPNNPAIPLNLSFVFRAQADAQAENAALARCLTIDPYYFPAMLALGRLQERTGDLRQAAKTYQNLLTIAPPEDQLVAEVQQAMNHARDIIDKNAIDLEAYLGARLQGVRAKYAQDGLERFAECEGIATGRRQIFTHKAKLLHYPWLPAFGFYKNEDFPWLKDLEAATAVIRDELLAALEHGRDGFGPYIDHPDGAPLNQWAKLNRSMDWNAFFLWKDGERVDKHCELCPQTAALVDKIPMIDIPTLGPTVLFSVLKPHAHIPAHTGSTNVRLIAHLPLIVPPGCRFRVGNETREWREGKAWVFDDTIDHEAWNDSDQIRVIAMIDIWNPYLSEAERSLVSILLNGMKDYYSAE